MSRRKYINLKKQMLHCIDEQFKEGMDKHSDKRNGERGSAKIYSRADREALKDTAALFCNWVKENNVLIRDIKDIKIEHVQAFVNHKAKDWSNATLKTHMSRLNKLDKVFDHSIDTYEKRWDGLLMKPSAKNETKHRSIGMSREDFSKLTDYAQSRRTHLKTALEVAGAAGLRVSEIAKLKGTDYDPNKGTLKIVDSKGGRSREIVIKEENRAVFERLRETCGDGRVCPVQYESLSQALNRAFKACDLEYYTDHKTGFHSIRKMVAQEMYDELKQSGESSSNAWEQVSHFLGHGDGRDDLFKAYIVKP